MSKDTFQTFNKLYFEFLSFLKTYSDGDKLFNSFYNKNYIIKSTNIKLFIRGWYDNISSKYNDAIKDGNVSFFLNKDYVNDVFQMDKSNDIVKYINFFKQNFNNFEKSVIDQFIGYVKELTKLSYMYFNTKET